MRAYVIPIGNSKGIRIPKPLLELCHIEQTVDLRVKGEMILIRPIKHKPRTGWESAFKRMHERGEDRLLIDARIDQDLGSWEW